MVTITPQLFKSPQELGHCDNYADLCEGDVIMTVTTTTYCDNALTIDLTGCPPIFDLLKPFDDYTPYDYTASYHMGMPKWYIDFVNKYFRWMV